MQDRRRRILYLSPNNEMYHGDPLKRRVSEIIDRLYEKVTYSH